MDNKYYPYIQLTKEKHPRLKIVRNAQDKNINILVRFLMVQRLVKHLNC